MSEETGLYMTNPNEEMTFVALPSEIVALQFDPDLPLPEHYQTTLKVRPNELAGGKDTHQVWNQRHEAWIGIELGDFIRLDTGPNDYYPIARLYFERKYCRPHELERRLG